MKQKVEAIQTVTTCQECKSKPAEVFKDWGGKLCLNCDHVLRDRLDQLRAMVNRCRGDIQ